MSNRNVPLRNRTPTRFGSKLMDAKQRKGLSWGKIAKNMDSSPQNVFRMIYTEKPGRETIRKLAKAIGCRQSDIDPSK